MQQPPPGLLQGCDFTWEKWQGKVLVPSSLEKKCFLVGGLEWETTPLCTPCFCLDSPGRIFGLTEATYCHAGCYYRKRHSKSMA